MAISKILNRSLPIGNKNMLNPESKNAVKERLATSLAVIAVFLVISVVVWVSMGRNMNIDTTSDINVNIIHEMNPGSSPEKPVEEYIEYEMPDISF